jgi:hypothetical protein
MRRSSQASFSVNAVVAVSYWSVEEERALGPRPRRPPRPQAQTMGWHSRRNRCLRLEFPWLATLQRRVLRRRVGRCHLSDRSLRSAPQFLSVATVSSSVACVDSAANTRSEISEESASIPVTAHRYHDACQVCRRHDRPPDFCGYLSTGCSQRRVGIRSSVVPARIR